MGGQQSRAGSTKLTAMEVAERATKEQGKDLSGQVFIVTVRLVAEVFSLLSIGTFARVEPHSPALRAREVTFFHAFQRAHTI